MAKFKTSPKVLKALDEVCKELAAMPEEELNKLLEEHKDGFYATTMRELDEFAKTPEFNQIVYGSAVAPGKTMMFFALMKGRLKQWANAWRKPKSIQGS